MSKTPVYTTTNGKPISDPFSTQRVSIEKEGYQYAPPVGPLLVQDFKLIDSLANFDRERIPERVVHAKGAGAFGYFEVTDDISDICCSKFLDTIGKKTRTFTRFSTVGGEKGSSDTARDPRGFATKFYTEEGNLDLVYNNTPIFFIRDPTKFPHFIHTQKRNPQTNLKDANMFWDYLTANPESLHQVMYLFSNRGTPANLRAMNGYSGHSYKWYNSKGEWQYVQVHFKSTLGFKTLNNEEAGELDKKNPDHHTKDLFDAIAQGDYPVWDCYIQTMTQDEAKKLPFSVFDLTKVWPHKDFPLRHFGRLVLNENPQNYFAEVEQAAFSPSNTVPGMEASNDPVLQSRLFSYPDTHRHRLGANFVQIPVNCPLKSGSFAPQIRDGPMCVNGNLGATPNYAGAYNCPVQYTAQAKPSGSKPDEQYQGEVVPFHWEVTDYDFSQPGKLWDVLGKQPGEQDALAHNVAVHVINAIEPIQERVCEYFSKANPEIGEKIHNELQSLRRSGKM
ncbi:Peroxisomal catalase [Brettanomyces nanus]|uniref:Catalase n=1 Tax=Eeniella nana TaxID=13502 RepID=A0A875S307_EENNA|nr:Peroxisomal catalase [Brettanomyces nanus]QPG73714.1 Peroxisomal catalase [Brettanomyces nanus]